MKTPAPLPAADLSDSEKEILRADATIAYEQGDYAAAYQKNVLLAQAGDPNAQTNNAGMSPEGRAGRQN